MSGEQSTAFEGVTDLEGIAYQGLYLQVVQPLSCDLCVWLDCSDVSTITETEGIISQINDKSGESNNFTAIGSPVTNASITNSLNVIDLNGSSGLASTSNFKLHQSFTIYAVAKVRIIDNTSDALFSILDNIGNKFNIQANNSNKFDGTAESNLHADIIPINTPYEYNYYIYQYTIDSDNNLATLYINGVQVGQVAYTGSIQEQGTIRVGVDSTATNYADCSLAEFKYYNGILTPTENTTIINELKSKWAILDPRTEANIKAVYDPSNINSFQTIGTVTQLITQLNDLSSNNLNLVSNTSFEPQTLASTKNNLNVINFSGTYLENVSYTLGNTCSFFVVSNVTPLVSNASQSLFSYDDVASNNDFQLDAGSSTQFNPRISGSILSTAANASTPPYQGAFKVYQLRLNRNTNAASLLIDNQVKINVFYANDLSSGNSSFRLACNRAVSQFLINDFAESIIIDGDVSASRATNIYNYLKGKWAL